MRRATSLALRESEGCGSPRTGTPPAEAPAASPARFDQESARDETETIAADEEVVVVKEEEPDKAGFCLLLMASPIRPIVSDSAAAVGRGRALSSEDAEEVPRSDPFVPSHFGSAENADDDDDEKD